MDRTVYSQYMAMVPLRMFDWPDGLRFGESVQLKILSKTCHSPVCQNYPASLSYRKAFLKVLMKKSEDQGEEIAGDLYMAYSDLLQQQSHHTTDGGAGDSATGDGVCVASDMAYRIYCPDASSDCRIILKETQSFVSHGTTGLQTWTAAVCLVEWILENLDFFSRRNVLELGCGIGLVGSALACWTNNSSSSSPSSSSSSSSSSAAPSSVLLTDHHPAVLQQLTENLSLNFDHSPTHPMEVSDSRDRDMSGSSIGCASPDVIRPSGGDIAATCLSCQHLAPFAWSRFCSAAMEASYSSPNLDCPATAGADEPVAHTRSCVAVAALNWCDVSVDNSPSHGLVKEISPEVILAADVVFDQVIIPHLVATLSALICRPLDSSTGAPVAVICCTIRNQETFQCFLSALDDACLSWKDLDLAPRRLWCDRSCAVRLLHVSIPIKE